MRPPTAQLQAGCTIASRHYLPEARVLARSFRELHPQTRFYVLVADDTPSDVGNEPFELVSMAATGIDRELCFRARPQELSYAATPFLLRALLRRGIRRVVFFKQETLLCSSAQSLWDRLHVAPILLAPHLPRPLTGDDGRERERQVLLSGAYNVGVLGVADHPTAHAFLDWWSDRVRHDCRHAVARGVHYEQRWLALAPSLFEGVHVDRRPSVNVGHWNLPDTEVSLADGVPRVDGDPVIAFRASGFDADHPDRATRYDDRLANVDLGDAALLFRTYAALLDGAGHRDRSDEYAYGAFADGEPIPEPARDLHRTLEPAIAARMGDPFAVGAGTFRAWLDGADGPSRVTRFWRAVLDARPDVAAAYPDPDGVDHDAFRAWIDTSGRHELDAAGFRSAAR